jgi:hypothetical protein
MAAAGPVDWLRISDGTLAGRCDADADALTAAVVEALASPEDMDRGGKSEDAAKDDCCDLSCIDDDDDAWPPAVNGSALYAAFAHARSRGCTQRYESRNSYAYFASYSSRIPMNLAVILALHPKPRALLPSCMHRKCASGPPAFSSHENFTHWHQHDLQYACAHHIAAISAATTLSSPHSAQLISVPTARVFCSAPNESTMT